MNKIESWLERTTRSLLPEAKARVLTGFSEASAATYLREFENPDPLLAVWHRTSSTAVSDDVNPRTNAAILP